MLIKCVVACHNASGSPDFYFCIVSCSENEYELGKHYDLAKRLATTEGYEEPFVIFDEKEAPAWLLNRFVWASASTTDSQTVLAQILRDVTNSLKKDPCSLVDVHRCEIWAIDTQYALKPFNFKVETWRTVPQLADTHHVFLRINDKFYDCECLDGVDNYTRLPAFSSVKPQPVVLIDSNYVSAIDRHQLTLEQLKERGCTLGYNGVFE